MSYCHTFKSLNCFYEAKKTCQKPTQIYSPRKIKNSPAGFGYGEQKKLIDQLYQKFLKQNENTRNIQSSGK